MMVCHERVDAREQLIESAGAAGARGRVDEADAAPADLKQRLHLLYVYCVARLVCVRLLL